MGWITSLWSRMHRLAEMLVAVALCSMFATFLIQIVFRYFLNLPLGWTVEYVTIAWLWGILFGYAFVLRDDEVIRLDIVYDAVSVPVRRFMDGSSSVVVAAILLWSLPKIYDYVTFMSVERTAFLHIPFDVLFSIYIPFVLAVVARSLRTTWRAIKGRGYEVAPTPHAEVSDYV